MKHQNSLKLKYLTENSVKFVKLKVHKSIRLGPMHGPYLSLFFCWAKLGRDRVSATSGPGRVLATTNNIILGLSYNYPIIKNMAISGLCLENMAKN